MFQGNEQRRHHARFEPAHMEVTATLSDKSQLRGRVLDSSRGGMAIALDLPEEVALPNNGSVVSLTLTSDGRSADQTRDNSAYVVARPLGDATVLRGWSAPRAGMLDIGKGIAVKFHNDLPDNDAAADLLRGLQQQARLKSQAELAAIDMAYLGNYRRDLIECQTKLFILALTLSVTLAGAYFVLNYHSVAVNQVANQGLSLWRALIAALPGGLAIACALMVAQKAISVQRVDSYLIVLKECKTLDQFPREYRGWESAIRKFRNVLNTNVCSGCSRDRKCGMLRPADQANLRSKRFLRHPTVDLYHLIIYTSFFFAFGMSIITLLYELLRFGWRNTTYMLIAATIALLMAGATAALLFIFYHLRKGRFSMEHFKLCWIDLLNKCPWPA